MTQKASTKKKGPEQSTALVEATAVQTLQHEESTPEPEEGTPQPEEAKTEAESAPTELETPNPEKIEPASKPETSKPAAVKPLTMVYLNSEIEALKQIVSEHGQHIAELQEALARKRKAVPNGKVQIKDKQTGKVYPSKNNCYKTLLKSDDLKDLVDKGVFGDDPAKNSFGWYALVREMPDRFEEVKIGTEDQA